jgi:arginyl-tRNA synthetase
MENLEQYMAALGLSPPAPFQGTPQSLTNPLDICRAYLADILTEILECSQEDALSSIQWPNNIFNGDLAVVLPKLRRSGAKADETGVVIMGKVQLPIVVTESKAAIEKIADYC